ncbi:MAG TPA: hypothetical protein VGD90_04530 [Sphingobacteriaceae bacterium]
MAACFTRAVILLMLSVPLTACSSKKGARTNAPAVPIALSIRGGNSYHLGSVNLDILRLKLYQDLRQFQNTNLDLVETDENPEVLLDIDIDNFIIWPKDERTVRRVFSRTIQVGTDSKGKPVFQTVSASVDFTQTKIKSNGRFIANLTFKGNPPEVFKRTFAPSYTYFNTSAGNINGDPRAVDPAVLSAGAFSMEPMAEDFLLSLLREELMRRISDELRSHYR